MLKDYFRKSSNKYIEANALAAYEDGRGIPAIRGHVERNLDNLCYDEYLMYREVVLILGGQMEDLDEYFDNYDIVDEYYEVDDLPF